jgi:hypothetical protein
MVPAPEAWFAEMFGDGGWVGGVVRSSPLTRNFPLMNHSGDHLLVR